MNKEFLPIGSVVKLKEGKKCLMIIGFCQSSAENQSVIYDYNGCFYPEGVVSSEVNFLFNNEQIEQILFKGFINEEETKFKHRLNEFLTNGTIDGVKPDMNIPMPNQSINNTTPEMFTPETNNSTTNQQ